jgi:hypothetical protein
MKCYASWSLSFRRRTSFRPGGSLRRVPNLGTTAARAKNGARAKTTLILRKLL